MIAGDTTCPFCNAEGIVCPHFVGWTEDGRNIQSKFNGHLGEPLRDGDQIVSTGVTARVYRDETEPTGEQIPCIHCENGRWETECCDGSNHCDCRGERIDMGTCRVCEGKGWHGPDANTRANLDMIRGQCFVGRGPTSGMWANMGTRGGHPINHK